MFFKMNILNNATANALIYFNFLILEKIHVVNGVRMAQTDWKNIVLGNSLNSWEFVHL